MDSESHGSVGLFRKQIDPGNRVGDQDLRYPPIYNTEEEAMFPKYMMATKAIHQLGDISSKEPDICVIHKEDADNYIGNWVFGLGFINVKFPKSSTRDLTPDEVTEYNGKQLVMSGMFSGKPSYECGSIQLD